MKSPLNAYDPVSAVSNRSSWIRARFLRIAGPTATALLLAVPGSGRCAGGEDLHVSVWSAVPFGLLLLAIAVLPLMVGHWWHSNRNKAIVTALIAAPSAVYLVSLGDAGIAALLHELKEYFSFIVLLGALYVISGSIVVRVNVPGTPITNAFILMLGAVLANLIGTTGASMVLIRPILRINAERERTSHIPVFFILIVSNCGGLLTPLGDPPLFLGFLKGIDFFWTMKLFPQWAMVNGLLLAVFLVCDSMAHRRETRRALAIDEARTHRLRIAGVALNAPLLGLVLVAVLLQSADVGGGLGKALGIGDLTLRRPWGELLMVGAAVLSLVFSPRHHLKENQFSWVPIVEVAVLFVGIFITMAPALALLKVHGPRFGVTEPWQYFWLTGGLSSFLDNAPTYVTFATLAAGSDRFAALATDQPVLLAAISCGAVFMGANSYIGNGPNFMVKAIAEEAGYQMPSFFGYMVRYSIPILVPILAIITVMFFR